jgi:hypothetical protein
MAELKCSDGTVIEISKETEQELRKAFGPVYEPKLGDILTCNFGERVVMYSDELGRLAAFHHSKTRDPWPDPTDDLTEAGGVYKSTGRNVFRGDSLTI